jgi:hypothetical protein
VQASCIVAREMEPPEGEKPIEWRLLTNLPVDGLGQAARMIDWYRSRWEVEMCQSYNLRKSQMANSSMAFADAAFRRDRSRARSCAVA